jgi:hypothetical protein
LRQNGAQGAAGRHGNVDCVGVERVKVDHDCARLHRFRRRGDSRERASGWRAVSRFENQAGCAGLHGAPGRGRSRDDYGKQRDEQEAGCHPGQATRVFRYAIRATELSLARRSERLLEADGAKPGPTPFLPSAFCLFALTSCYRPAAARPAERPVAHAHAKL